MTILPRAISVRHNSAHYHYISHMEGNKSGISNIDDIFFFFNPAADGKKKILAHHTPTHFSILPVQ